MEIRGTLLLVCAMLLAASPAPSAPLWRECLVLTSDFTTLGFASTLQRDPPWAVTPDLEEVGSDAVARFHGGLYYVINRGGASSLQILDPAHGYQTIREFSLGSGRNPQDIAFRDDGIAFVSCYDEALLLKVDVEREQILATYSTEFAADADGLPETSWMQAVGDQLYIAGQRLDRNNWWVPAGPGCLLVFDMEAETWVDMEAGTSAVDPLPLAGENPYTQLELSGDRATLRVGCTGWYGVLDGGVEGVDLAAHSSQGFEVTEAELGGDLLDFESIDACTAWVIVSDPMFQTSIRTYDRCQPAITVVEQAPDYVHTDIAYDGQSYVYSCDRTPGADGVKVFAAATGEKLTAQPLATGLPPHRIVLPRDEAYTHAALAPAAGLRLAAPWPNPANPGTLIQLRGPVGLTVPLNIYDLRGRRIRSGSVTLGSDGAGSYFFDGYDDRGRAVASGSYQIVAGVGFYRLSRGFTLVR